MAIRPIEIQLIARDATASTLRRVTDNLKGIATEANKTAKATDKIQASLGQVGSTGRGLDMVKDKIAGLGRSMEQAKKHSSDLTTGLENIRNAGAGLALAGAGGIALSNALIQVYKEGARADEMLSAMMKKRGEGGRIEEMSNWASKLSRDAAMIDDDPIKEAAAGLLGFGLNAKQVQEIMPGLIGQSRLYHQELGQVAMAFGKAFASGNAGALKRSGVTLDPKDLDALSKITDHAEKQRAMFALVKESMDKYALSMREGMSEAEIQANLLANSVDEAQTNIGKGATSAQQSLQELVAQILVAANTAPQTQEAAGSILFYGSYAATALGSVVTLGAQIGILTQAFPALGTAGATAMAAIQAAALPVLAVLSAIILSAKAATMAFHLGEQIANEAEVKNIAAHPEWSAAQKMRAIGHLVKNLDEEGETGQSKQMREKFAAIAATKEGQAALAADKSLALPDTAEDAAIKTSMAKIKALMPSAAPSPVIMGAAMGTPGTTTAASSLSGPNVSTGGLLVDSRPAVRRKPVAPAGAPELWGGIFGSLFGGGGKGKARGGGGGGGNTGIFGDGGIFGGGEITARGHGRGTIQNDGRIRITFDDIVIDSPGRQLSRNIAALPLAPGF